MQKSAARIILQDKYGSYDNSLKILKIQSLEERREKLCTKFALKAEGHTKFTNWFNLNSKKTVTRSHQEKYSRVHSRTVKFEKSPLSHLTNTLNSYYRKKSP